MDHDEALYKRCYASYDKAEKLLTLLKQTPQWSQLQELPFTLQSGGIVEFTCSPDYECVICKKVHTVTQTSNKLKLTLWENGTQNWAFCSKNNRLPLAPTPIGRSFL